MMKLINELEKHIQIIVKKILIYQLGLVSIIVKKHVKKYPLSVLSKLKMNFLINHMLK